MFKELGPTSPINVGALIVRVGFGAHYTMLVMKNLTQTLLPKLKDFCSHCGTSGQRRVQAKSSFVALSSVKAQQVNTPCFLKQAL